MEFPGNSLEDEQKCHYCKREPKPVATGGEPGWTLWTGTMRSPCWWVCGDCQGQHRLWKQQRR